MADVVERMREIATPERARHSVPQDVVMLEAADLIEQQAAEIARLTKERDEARADATRAWAGRDAQLRSVEDACARNDELWAEIRALKTERDSLRAEVARKDEALAFYADPGDYVAPFTGGMGKLWRDCGDRARAAKEPSRG